MPTHIRIIITVLVVIAAIGTHLYEAAIGQSVDQWLVLLLGAFMIFGLWLFPEAKKPAR